jgi:hypothetical protein
MSEEQKKSPEKSDDKFWKAVALIGTLASLAGLVISIIK